MRYRQPNHGNSSVPSPYASSKQAVVENDSVSLLSKVLAVRLGVTRLIVAADVPAAPKLNLLAMTPVHFCWLLN